MRKFFRKLFLRNKKVACAGTLRFGVNVARCEECKADSIAHKISAYFDRDTVCCRMLFAFDHQNEKLLVSNEALKYLLSLHNDIELLQNYDMEIVEKIDFRNNEV